MHVHNWRLEYAPILKMICACLNFYLKMLQHYVNDNFINDASSFSQSVLKA